jgi:hypothetical protein
VARLDRAALLASAASAFGATPDPEGLSDLVANRGHISVAASGAEAGAAVKRLAKVPGYRWLVINATDLFAVNALTIGTKIGIIDESGRVLKNADLPRAK